MQGLDIVSVCNVYCPSQPSLGHRANKTPLRPALGEGEGDDNKERPYVFPLTRTNTHKTLTKKKIERKKMAPVKTHHTSARSAEACLQLSAHHAGIPGRLCPAERLMLPRNI